MGATLDAPTRLNENQKANERVKKRKAGIWGRAGGVNIGSGGAARPGADLQESGGTRGRCQSSALSPVKPLAKRTHSL